MGGLFLLRVHRGSNHGCRAVTKLLPPDAHRGDGRLPWACLLTRSSADHRAGSLKYREASLAAIRPSSRSITSTADHGAALASQQRARTRPKASSTCGCFATRSIRPSVSLALHTVRANLQPPTAARTQRLARNHSAPAVRRSVAGGLVPVMVCQAGVFFPVRPLGGGEVTATAPTAATCPPPAAAPALVGELGEAGSGAHRPACTSGHRLSPVTNWSLRRLRCGGSTTVRCMSVDEATVPPAPDHAPATPPKLANCLVPWLVGGLAGLWAERGPCPVRKALTRSRRLS